MKRYPIYKTTNIDWIGEYPNHWQLCCLKYITEVKDGTHDTPKTVAEGENTYPLITSKNVKNNSLDFKNVTFISKDDYLQIIKRSNVEEGDIIMPMIGTVGNPIIIDTDKRFAIKNVALFKVYKATHNHYLKYFLESNFVQQQFSMLSRGGVQDFVSLTILKRLMCFKLCYEEQTAIANFLDFKVSKINDLISKKQKLINLLKEERAVIINQAVTKGINPTVEMKDSGIEWLKDIPEHWKIYKLKFLIKDKLNNGIFKKREYFGNGTKIINVIDLYNDNLFINFEKLEKVQLTLKEYGGPLCQDTKTLRSTHNSKLPQT